MMSYIIEKCKIECATKHFAKPLKYDYLLKLERAGEEIWLVEDGEQLKKVNVSQMLNGVESEYERKQNIHLHIEGDVRNRTIILGNDNDA